MNFYLGSRPVYGSNMRGNTPQSTGMSRGGGSIMMNGAGNPPPRMRGTHPGKVTSCRQMTVPRVYPSELLLILLCSYYKSLKKLLV